jgi:rRNA maturation endonuclease Nob1
MRLAQHETKPWWRDVVRVTLTHYDHHLKALKAEGEAQETENPVHNVVRNGRVPNSRERRAANQREFAARKAALDRDRRVRGVYAVFLRCANCFHTINELPMGTPKDEADCPNCGVPLRQEQAA